MDPSLPTMAQTFRDAGYQAYAVGKLHVYPQRDRIGFDDVILNEEGRHHLGGGSDDYERYLHDHGYGGQELTHAMGNNSYTVRPWHLPGAVPPDVLDHAGRCARRSAAATRPGRRSGTARTRRRIHRSRRRPTICATTSTSASTSRSSATGRASSTCCPTR